MPAPLVVDAQFLAAYRYERCRILEWVRWHRPGGWGATQVAPPPPPASQEGAFLPAWRGHYMLRPQGTGHAICIKCGARPRRLADRFRPCRPQGTLPRRACADIASGRYEDALARAPDWVRDLARRAGRRHLPQGEGAAPHAPRRDAVTVAVPVARTTLGRMLLGQANRPPVGGAGAASPQGEFPRRAPQGARSVADDGDVQPRRKRPRTAPAQAAADPQQRTLMQCWVPQGAPALAARAATGDRA